MTFAGGSVLGPEVVTSEFKVNYLRPAQGTDILVRAEVVSSGRTQAVCRCEIFAVSDGKEALCAIALGTIAGTNRAKPES
ncbi:MAG: PaaI family thioesterase [Desulfohalobiaceae bacterium]|nr:PaaI family thioesterase [Desulfohalobiaceae bacterium]